MMDPVWSEICWSTFKYFIILIVSTYYILCISWIIKCSIIIDARCKHEDWSTALFVDLLYRISPKSYIKCGTYRSDTNSFMSRSEVGLHFTVQFSRNSVTQYVIWDIYTEYFPYWMKIRNRWILHVLQVKCGFHCAIFTKLSVTQYIIWDIICTEYFPYWMKRRNRGILHLHQVKCGFHSAIFTKLTVTQCVIWDIICTEHFPYWMKINRGILHLHQVKCGFHCAIFTKLSHAVRYLGHYLHRVFSMLDENKKQRNTSFTSREMWLSLCDFHETLLCPTTLHIYIHEISSESVNKCANYG